MRRLALCGAGAALVLASTASASFTRAPASSAFTPKAGGYKATVDGDRHLTFTYWTHPPAKVALFYYHGSHYSGDASVHHAKFDFGGYSHVKHRHLDVDAHWTSTEVVEGTYKEGDGATKHFRAHWHPPASGGGPLGAGQRLTAASVSPRPGHWKGPMLRSALTRVYFQYRGKARQVVSFGIDVCHCTVASARHRKVYIPKMRTVTVRAGGKFSGGGVVGRFTSATEAKGTFTGKFRDDQNRGVLGTWRWKATFRRAH